MTHLHRGAQKHGCESTRVKHSQWHSSNNPCIVRRGILADFGHIDYAWNTRWPYNVWQRNINLKFANKRRFTSRPLYEICWKINLLGMHGANLCFAFVAADDVRLFQRKIGWSGKYLLSLTVRARNFIKIHPAILIACEIKIYYGGNWIGKKCIRD